MEERVNRIERVLIVHALIMIALGATLAATTWTVFT